VSPSPKVSAAYDGGGISPEGEYRVRGAGSRQDEDVDGNLVNNSLFGIDAIEQRVQVTVMEKEDYEAAVAPAQAAKPTVQYRNP
jgi:hypothetical protein